MIPVEVAPQMQGTPSYIALHSLTQPSCSFEIFCMLGLLSNAHSVVGASC